MIKSAPFAIVLLLGAGATAGYLASSWHYSKEIKDQGALIATYRAALGIDKGDPGASIELNNEELRAKAEQVVGTIRGICSDYTEKSLALSKQLQAQKIPARSEKATQLWTPIATEFAERFDKDAKPDFMNLDSELRQRLGPGGMANTAVTEPELSANPLALEGGVMESLYICSFADELDQMAKRLPPNSAKP